MHILPPYHTIAATIDSRIGTPCLLDTLMLDAELEKKWAKTSTMPTISRGKHQWLIDAAFALLWWFFLGGAYLTYGTISYLL